MSDVDRIRAEVNRRKQQARQLGLPELTTNFYLEQARFYPVWTEHHPEIVPNLITDVCKAGNNAVAFSYSARRYSLTWTEESTAIADGNLHLGSTLSLRIDGNRVLEVYLKGDYRGYGFTKWQQSDVKAFIEGQWIASFKELAAEGERLHSLYLQREEAQRQDTESEDLASQFGTIEDHRKNSDSLSEEASVATPNTYLKAVQLLDSRLC